MYIVRSSMKAPRFFFAVRMPMDFPYCHTLERRLKRMLLFVRTGIFMLGIWPLSSC